MPLIRPYRASDWQDFLELDLETARASVPAAELGAFRERWPEILRSKFAWGADGPGNAKSALLVLETDDGKYGGHLWLTEQEDLFRGTPKLWVTTIALVASCRGRGWGRLLMERAIAEAQARALPLVGLGVEASNEAARKLYERMGFTTTRLTMERAT